MSAINRQERRILQELQSDGRLTNQELAERVHLSPSACWRRVRALEEVGIIESYRAVVDARKLGLADSVFAHVRLEKHSAETTAAFVSAVERRPEIVECYSTTGDEDYVLRVLVPNVRRYDEFLYDFLFELPYVTQVRSHFVLRTIKHSGRIPMEIVATDPPSD